MNPHLLEILHHLGKILLQLYCHHPCHTVHLSQSGYQVYLLNCISDYWKIDYKQMPTKRLIYRAFREDFCSEATFEKLCMFYYARKDKKNSAKIISEYLAIANCQRIDLKPYTKRFIDEYHAKHLKAKPTHLPQGWGKVIDRLSERNLKKLELRIKKRREREGKRNIGISD